MFDLLAPASNQISVIRMGGPRVCKLALIFHDHIKRIAELSEQYQSLVSEFWTNRDQLVYSGTALSADERLAICQRLTDLSDEIAEIGVRKQAYERMSGDVLDAVLVAKMVAFSRSLVDQSADAGERLVYAFEVLRDWRVKNLDGEDVDFLAMADRPIDFAAGAPGIFERLMAAWAMEAAPGVPLKLLLTSALAHLASVKPHLVPEFIASRYRLSRPYNRLSIAA